MSKVLQVNTIDRLPVPEAGRNEHFDAKVPGLLLRVSAGGKKTWYLWYTIKGERKRRRMALGVYGPAPALTLADAREKARRNLLVAAAGEDPGAPVKAIRNAPTFKKVAEDFLEMHSKAKKRSWQQDNRRIEGVLIPAWGDRKLIAIKRRDVLDLLDGIAARAPIEANRTLALIRKIWNWAASRDLTEVNPCFGVVAPGKENARDRVLTEDEIRQFWAACGGPEVPAYARDMFRLRLLTAQRGGEVAAMAWPHIDLAARTWYIPPEVAKNANGHLVPLSLPAVSILRAIKAAGGKVPALPASRTGRRASADFVFPARSVSGHALRPKLRDIGIENVGFTGHDLRRTAATHLGEMGMSRFIIGRVLNHTDPSVTARYDRHSYLAEKRDALDKWAARLAEILAAGEKQKRQHGLPVRAAD